MEKVELRLNLLRRSLLRLSLLRRSLLRRSLLRLSLLRLSLLWLVADCGLSWGQHPPQEGRRQTLYNLRPAQVWDLPKEVWDLPKEVCERPAQDEGQSLRTNYCRTNFHDHIEQICDQVQPGCNQPKLLGHQPEEAQQSSAQEVEQFCDSGSVQSPATASQFLFDSTQSPVTFRQTSFAFHRSRNLPLFLQTLHQTLHQTQSPSSQSAQQARGKADWTDPERLIEAHLNSGEFPLAEQQIDQLPLPQADFWRAELFRQQWLAGVEQGSLRSLNQMQDDHLRSQQLVWVRERVALSGSPQIRKLAESIPFGLSGPSNSSPSKAASEPTGKREGSTAGVGAMPGGTLGGVSGETAGGNGAAMNPRGGITQQDFFPLINLINSAIAADSWSINGGPGNLQAFPAGVFVDGSGVLQSIQSSKARGHQFGSRIGLGTGPSHDWYQDQGNRDAQLPSRLRKVSLTRLERAAQWKVARGEPMDETMLRLAGLTSIDFLVCDPKRNEILLIGPAGPWESNTAGRVVNRINGKPVLQLDDWVVCWRNASDQEGKFGCSIEPRRENLAAARQFITQSPLKGADWSEKLRAALGQQDILVFGIDPSTRTAATLVYADYHMKRIAMGLEPGLPEVPDFLQRLSLQATGERGVDLARWWFALKDLEISSDEQREFFSIDRLTLQVLSETEWLNREGERLHTEASLPATAAFAADFTRHFESIAERYPVYQELRNVFLWATIANLIRQEKMDKQIGWKHSFFGSSANQQLSYLLQKFPQPSSVESIMNERQFRQRSAGNGGKMIQGRMVGVSGGVDCQLSVKLAGLQYNRLTPDPSLQQVSERVPPNSAPKWWWD
jgi:hypothetical protein